MLHANIISKDGSIPSKNLWSYVLMLFPNIFIIHWLRKLVIFFALKKCNQCDFEPGFRFYYGHNIHASHVAFANTVIMDYQTVSIGKGTAFSRDCIVISAQHDLKDRKKILGNPVTIGRNVWIATRSIILPGVSIGDHSVIGAGSVVTHDVPAHCLVAGNPARVIKYFKE